MNKEEIVIEPYLMAVLSNRLYTIGKEMTSTMLKSSRSLVMNICRDFSTAICHGNGDVIMIPPGIPCHVANGSLLGHSILDGRELNPGDCYLNNSPYYGNTHHADYTYIVPVFYKGELVYITYCRGHQGDIGNSLPTTYMPNACDMYEEGAIDFPAIKVQEDYKDIEDIIRIVKARVRIPDVWYGDFLAGVGSARIGERRLIEMCEEYGLDTIKAFNRQWQEYGKERMIAEIRKLPKAQAEYQIKHDALPGVLPQGITITIKGAIDPDEGWITVDFRENADLNPCGLNLSEACLLADARTGVLNVMPPEMLHNEGAMSRIRVLMREGSCIGPAVRPWSSSVATTNVSDRVISGVQALFSKLIKDRAMGEGGATQCPAVAVVSGRDWRRSGEFVVSQIFAGATGGMGVGGHDGWVAYMYPCVGGAMYWTTNEILEKRFPMLVLEEELIQDSAGAGQWDAAPGCKFVFTPRHDPMAVAYSCDGQVNLPKGTDGGLEGAASASWKYNVEKGESSRIELPSFAVPTITKGEALVSECSVGGGYGNPLDRDPELVRHRAREGWISVEKAYEIYGVVLEIRPEIYAVDYEATKKRREELRKNDKLREELREKWREKGWRAKRLPMEEEWAKDYYKIVKETLGEEIAKAMVRKEEA